MKFSCYDSTVEDVECGVRISSKHVKEHQLQISYEEFAEFWDRIKDPRVGIYRDDNRVSKIYRDQGLILVGCSWLESVSGGKFEELKVNFRLLAFRPDADTVFLESIRAKSS